MSCSKRLVLIIVIYMVFPVKTIKLKNVPTKITMGAYWNKLNKAIPYEASIPLLYEGEIPNDNYVMHPYSLSTEGCNEWDEGDYCKLTKWLDTVDKEIEVELTRVNNMLQADVFETSDIISKNKSRNPRSISFIATILSWCCGIATESSFKALVTDHLRIKSRISQIKENIHDDQVDLTRVTDAMQKYSSEIKQKLLDIDNTFHNLEEKLSKNLILDDTRFQRLFSSAFYGIERNSRRIFQTLHSISKGAIINDCKNKLIPSHIIPVTILTQDLKSLQEKLDVDGFKLAIPLSDITWYYKLKIADCEFADEKIFISVKVPILNKLHSFELYEFTNIPYSWKNSTCVIIHDSTYLAVDGDSVRTITGAMLRECKVQVNELCFISRYSTDIVSGPSCPEILFKGATASVINKYCAYKCQDGNAMVITQVNFETYVITHPPRSIKLDCGNNTQYITNDDTEIIGSIEIKLPCHCKLIVNNKIKIDKNYPCDKRAIKELEVTRILPSFWSKLDSMHINRKNLLFPTKFENFTEIFNPNWTFTVPHFKISRQTHDNIYYKKKTQPKSKYNNENYYSWQIVILYVWSLLLTIVMATSMLISYMKFIKGGTLKKIIEGGVTENFELVFRPATPTHEETQTYNEVVVD